MELFGRDAMIAAAGCTSRQLSAWSSVLGSHGRSAIEGRLPLHEAIAVGAALHFRAGGSSKPRVDALFRKLLRDLPAGDDWLVVDRRNRSPIGVEAAPFEASLRFAERAPIVFDPSSFTQRLRAHEAPE